MGTNIFRVDTQAVKEKLLLNPFVASAEIKRVLPHTISIKISEYDPMAVVPVAGSFMQVSKEGYCLSYSPEISDLDLPVVSGLNIKNKVSPGSKIQNKSLLVAMKILEYCNKDSLIAEVDAHDVSRLSLFTYSKTKILLGNERQLEDKISLALEIASKVPEAQYIDVRFPKSPVYK